jgi:hypothetical protein
MVTAKLYSDKVFNVLANGSPPFPTTPHPTPTFPTSPIFSDMDFWDSPCFQKSPYGIKKTFKEKNHSFQNIEKFSTNVYSMFFNSACMLSFDLNTCMVLDTARADHSLFWFCKN